MEKIQFVFTEDGSTGLYDESYNDIYHSKSGALKEANDKFINPSFLSEFLSEKKFLKILDICYGIGYNTKAALNIVDDNIQIDCLDYSHNLAAISPLIKDTINNIEMKLFLLTEIINSVNNSYDLYSIIKEQYLIKFNQFFDHNMVALINFLLSEGYICNGETINLSFLHNIYYNYISQRENNGLKFNKYKNSSINFYFDDARVSLKTLNNVYDIVFLDGFSPQKVPTLWTIDFLSLVKEHMNDKSVLVSYSKSTPFRSALQELGFYIGKTYIDNIDMGTVASLDKNKIINPLSNYDYKLLSTRSGITYKDKSLLSSPDEILQKREIEQSSSNRLSHTAFLKQYKE